VRTSISRPSGSEKFRRIECGLWTPLDPHLYTLSLPSRCQRTNIIDQAESYRAVRSSRLKERTSKINGETIFQRLVLYQGYWPESVMTAPTMPNSWNIFNGQKPPGSRAHEASEGFEERFSSTCGSAWLSVLGRVC